MLKSFSRLIFVLLVVTMVFVGFPTSHHAVAQTLSDEEQIRQILTTYFELKYEARAIASPKAFGQLIASNARAKRFLQNETDKREIEYFHASLFNLKYDDYTYDLDIKSIEISEDKTSATVVLTDSVSMIIEGLAPQVSEIGGVQHTISCVKENKAWKISEDNYEDDLVRFLNAGNLTKNEAMAIIRKDYEEDQKQKKQQASSYARQYVSMTGGSYNGGLAGLWASGHYVNGGPYDFNDIGWSDCTNFVSYAVNAGGIPQTLADPNGWYITDFNHVADWWKTANTFLQDTTGDYWKGLYTNSAPDGYIVSYIDYIQIGDVVAWNLHHPSTPSYMDHVAIVTGYAGMTPLVTDRQSCCPEYHYMVPYTFYSYYGRRFIDIYGY